MTPATKPILDDVETNDEVFVTDGPCDVADDPINPQEQASNPPSPPADPWKNFVFLICHVTIAKEAWQILEMTYEGTKKLNEVVIRKVNLGEKTEDSKIVRKIQWSLLESFCAKVTTIEESKDLNEIKIQKLIGSLQTYELSLPSQRKSKSLALKTINERLDAQDSSNEDEVEKDVAYLAKNFCKFLKFKRDGKSFEKGKFSKFKKDKKDFKKKDSRDSSPSEMEEHGDHTEVESIGVGEESNDEGKECVCEGTNGLQETYNSLLEKSEEYARVAKAAIRKM
nr:uncharacterized protein LOC112012814 [Quercus suber]